jgi:hypothetical protein
MGVISFTHRRHLSTTNGAPALPTRTDRWLGTKPCLPLSRRKDRPRQHLSNWPAMRSVAVLRYRNRRGPRPMRSYTRPVRTAGHATDGTDGLPGTFAPQCRLTVQLSTQANGHVESFNGRLRDECLNASWFRNLADARTKISSWRDEYNGERPRSVRKIDRSVLGGPKLVRAVRPIGRCIISGCRSIPPLDSPPAVPTGL